MQIGKLVAIFIAVAAVSPARPAPVAAQITCPAEGARTRAKVLRFLTSPDLAPFRQQYGMTQVKTGSVALLTDAANTSACQRLRGIVGTHKNTRYPEVFSYYYANGFYFVSFAWVVPAGRTYTRFAPLIVLRSDFSYVDSFAM